MIYDTRPRQALTCTMRLYRHTSSRAICTDPKYTIWFRSEKYIKNEILQNVDLSAHPARSPLSPFKLTTDTAVFITIAVADYRSL